MKIGQKNCRTIWFEKNLIKIIDQTKLPHKFVIKQLKTVKDSINAIKAMQENIMVLYLHYINIKNCIT